MHKSSFRAGRSLLRAMLGMLLAGVLGAVLLVFLYMSMAKTPSHALAPLAEEQPTRPSPAADPPSPKTAAPGLQAAPLPAGPLQTTPSQRRREESRSGPFEFSYPTRPEGRATASPPVPRLTVSPNQKSVTVEIMRPVTEIRHVVEKNPETGIRRLRAVSEIHYVPERLQVPIPPPALPTAADQRAEELAAKIRESEDESEQAALREQLLETLNTAFDERRERQSESIEELEKQLEELRTLHQQRGERKSEIVQRRMSELLAEPDVLAWEPTHRAATIPQRTPATFSAGGITMPGPAIFPAAPATSARTPGTAPVGAPPPGALAPSSRASAPASAASEDPFGSQPSSPTEDPFGTQPSTSTPAAEDPFGSQPSSPSEDPFSQPTPPRTPAGNIDPAAATAERRPASAAEFGFPARGDAVRVDDAERIVEMISEIANIEAELASGAAPEADAKRRLQLARVKLSIAEVGWEDTEQLLRSRVDTAKAELEAAEQRLKERESQPDTPFNASVQIAQSQIKQATAKLHAAQAQLRAWQRADEILQKHRASIEQSAAAQPSDTEQSASESTEPQDQPSQ